MGNFGKISPKTFYISLILIPLFTIMAMSAITFKSLFLDNVFPEMEWYRGKLYKLAHENNIETLFIGDSSLESVIDDKLFSMLSQSKTSNMALVGIFGYAGSYNMLKKVLSNPNNKIKNVIIVQTLDMMTRPVSYKGYLLSMGGLDDFFELSGDEQGEVIYAFLKVMLSSENFISILKYQLFEEKDDALSLVSLVNKKFDEQKKSENIFQINTGEYNSDRSNRSRKEILEEAEKYIENYTLRHSKYSHSHKYKRVVDKQPEAINTALSAGKTKFLEKIIVLSQKHGINLIYIHGPVWDKVKESSGLYIELVNNRLRKMPFRFIDEIVTIQDEDLFDTSDHVLPVKKPKYTLRYFGLLSSDLR